MLLNDGDDLTDLDDFETHLRLSTEDIFEKQDALNSPQDSQSQQQHKRYYWAPQPDPRNVANGLPEGSLSGPRKQVNLHSRLNSIQTSSNDSSSHSANSSSPKFPSYSPTESVGQDQQNSYDVCSWAPPQFFRSQGSSHLECRSYQNDAYMCYPCQYQEQNHTPYSQAPIPEYQQYSSSQGTPSDSAYPSSSPFYHQ